MYDNEQTIETYYSQFPKSMHLTNEIPTVSLPGGNIASSYFTSRRELFLCCINCGHVQHSYSYSVTCSKYAYTQVLFACSLLSHLTVYQQISKKLKQFLFKTNCCYLVCVIYVSLRLFTSTKHVYTMSVHLHMTHGLTNSSVSPYDDYFRMTRGDNVLELTQMILYNK